MNHALPPAVPGAPAVAVDALDVPPRTKPSLYPEQFAQRVAGRVKRQLGDYFGLANFGVNLTTLPPGAASALLHAHTRQDEFIHVLAGHPTLISRSGRTRLAPGMCAGFKADTGDAHCLVNETQVDVVYLEVGDRTPGDEVTYPDDDLAAQFVDGGWRFCRKNGEPY